MSSSRVGSLFTSLVLSIVPGTQLVLNKFLLIDNENHIKENILPPAMLQHSKTYWALQLSPIYGIPHSIPQLACDLLIRGCLTFFFHLHSQYLLHYIHIILIIQSFIYRRPLNILSAFLEHFSHH